jgi:hypothetical protein
VGEELGRIERPLVDSFGGERKVFVVPLVLRGNDAPADYSEKFDLYWQQVREQLSKLEEKTGRIHRIYHEAIVVGGEDGLKIMEKMNTSSCSLVKERCERGAGLEATDDRELAEESMDWERMLLAGFLSEKVARMVSQFYVDASRKRYEHMAKRIDETLGPGELAILFITEGHSLQFPRDIQVFSVFPPALDEIHKWFRDVSTARPEKE